MNHSDPFIHTLLWLLLVTNKNSKTHEKKETYTHPALHLKKFYI